MKPIPTTSTSKNPRSHQQFEVSPPSRTTSAVKAVMGAVAVLELLRQLQVAFGELEFAAADAGYIGIAETIAVDGQGIVTEQIADCFEILAMLREAVESATD